MARQFQDWKFFNKNVQQGMAEGRYVNAAFTLLAAGPSRLAAAGLSTSSEATSSDVDFIFPIGVVQNFNLGQQSSVMRLFEIGSERSYMIRGRTVGTIGLGRIMYHGPSLLRVLYGAHSGQMSSGADFFSSAEFDNLISPGTEVAEGLNATTSGTINTNSGGKKDRYLYAPGEPQGNMWLNLASDVFSQPIGLGMFMKDSNADIVGAFYFESCMITNHGFATDAGGTIVTENASMTFERIVPLDMQNIETIYDENIFSGIASTGSAS